MLPVAEVLSGAVLFETVGGEDGRLEDVAAETDVVEERIDLLNVCGDVMLLLVVVDDDGGLDIAEAVLEGDAKELVSGALVVAEVAGGTRGV